MIVILKSLRNVTKSNLLITIYSCITIRDARPRLSCLLEKNQDACLIAVRDDGADLVVVDGGSVLRAITDFNAQPIISEIYGNGSTKYSERPAVVVVKKGSPIRGLGKYLVHYVISKKIIEKIRETFCLFQPI